MTAERSPIKLPNKDCHNCKSRRIPCDRTTPNCRKCISRSLDCPGYGVYLRWGQGVASRGKFTGRAEPVLRDLQVSQNPLQSCAGINFPDVSLSIRTPHFPFDSLITQLLHHFDRAVATRLAWVDDHRNPWRSVIMPLSHYSSTVRYSVLALASKDLASRYQTDHPWVHRLQVISGHYQNAALSWLSGCMRALLQAPNQVKNTDRARCILASALILYNLELLTAPAAQWRMHIQCAREIIQWKLQSAPSALYTNVADAFLFYEYYFTSVFVELTTFDLIDHLQENIPAFDNITLFSDFIRIMHIVTRAERLAYTTQSMSQIAPIEYTILDIKAAKARMMQLSQIIEFKSTQGRRDFECLVDMFYHATLIYSHRVLANNLASEQCILSSRNVLLEHALRLSCSADVAQDLVWPLFIAGSESRGHQGMQSTIEQAMLNVIRISGHLDRSRVLNFLKTFWSSDLSHDITWVHYARDKSINFSSLIII
ncbi:fungal-specific transcription factor domain-containing protein [Aspergillus ambiguus]|uniref:Zn(II)2Cys6 transcription factor n=1 Tax=Aspergillus ambiguus TaxID=176160 RepID=UPI003CCDFB31